MPHDERIALGADFSHVRGDRRVELGSEPRTEIASLRGKSEQDRAIARRLRARGDRRGDRFAVEVHERGMLDDDHDIGPMLAELIGHCRDASGAGDDRVNFSATRAVDERARGRRRLECHFPQRIAARFGKNQNVRHIDQRTLASVCSRRTSSGTAATPSPMIRPAGRSGGSSIFFTATRTSPN